MFNHTDPRKVASALEASSVCRDIIQTVGDRVCFAVRVKVRAYAESVLACWVMVAVRFRPLMKLR
jgi:hypothetical protein